MKSKLFSSNFIILRQIWILLTSSPRSHKINKVWGEKNESERRERVCKNLELDKSKINSESSSSESKNSSSKNSNQL
ncbi:MAG: hypothetical protein H9Q66_02675 [Spiroplasma ixodetis]|nr:hypothetical protein [Spiroplasma ixodetis]